MKKLLVLILLITPTLINAQEGLIPIYSIQTIIGKNDTAFLKEISVDMGVPTVFPTIDMGYYFVVESYNGQVLLRENLGISFRILAEPPVDIELNETLSHVRIPIYPAATKIVYYHGDKNLLTVDLSKYFCDRNGRCDMGENRYICPEDCMEKETTTTIPQPQGKSMTWVYVIGGVFILVFVAILLFKKNQSQPAQEFDLLYKKWK